MKNPVTCMALFATLSMMAIAASNALAQGTMAWPWASSLHTGKCLQQILEESLKFEKRELVRNDWLSGEQVTHYHARDSAGKLFKIDTYVHASMAEYSQLTIYSPTGKPVAYSPTSTYPILRVVVVAGHPREGGSNGLFPQDPVTDISVKDRVFQIFRDEDWNHTGYGTESELFTRHERVIGRDDDYLQARAGGQTLTPPRKVSPREILETFQKAIQSAVASAITR